MCIFLANLAPCSLQAVEDLRKAHAGQKLAHTAQQKLWAQKHAEQAAALEESRQLKLDALAESRAHADRRCGPSSQHTLSDACACSERAAAQAGLRAPRNFRLEGGGRAAGGGGGARARAGGAAGHRAHGL